MALLATHLCATLFLLPIGLRRLFCSSSLYLANPALFRSKTWYLSDPKWKNLDLYALIVALPIASFSLIFLFLSITTASPTYRFSFLHQSLLVSLYWVLTILVILRESIDLLAILDNFLFVFGGIVFFVEYSFIGEGVSSGLVGGAVFGLCGGLSLVCGFCCLYLAIRPGAFFAEFCLCCGLVWKGTWFLQAGLSVYTDAFGFKGCHKIEVLPGNQKVELKCDLVEDAERAVALVNLLFVGHAIVVFLVSLVVFGLLSSNRNLRHGEASGPLLARLESESNLMRVLPEFELE